VHHNPSALNSELSILHCDNPCPGGLPCNGIMELVSTATDPGGVSRETWQCTQCRCREFHTVVEAVEVAPEEPEPEFFCTFCHNPYEPGAEDALHACEACTVWYNISSVN